MQACWADLSLFFAFEFSRSIFILIPLSRNTVYRYIKSLQVSVIATVNLLVWWGLVQEVGLHISATGVHPGGDNMEWYCQLLIAEDRHVFLFLIFPFDHTVRSEIIGCSLLFTDMFFCF
jgi:hypothetical protein